MIKLVLLRHGQSVWNKAVIFTGWTDVDLTEQGIEEAHQSGRLFKEAGYRFDLAYTSVLKRAIETLSIVLKELGEENMPIKKSWRLNERHYGALQGRKKQDVVDEVGPEQAFKWRRGYDFPPPALDEDDRRYNRDDPLYANLDKGQIPRTESLKDTVERVMPYWREVIAPSLKKDSHVLIVAHGNSLRGLVKFLDNIPDDKIAYLNIPTGIPLVYELDDDLKPIKHYYLGDPEAAKKAANAVEHQA